MAHHHRFAMRLLRLATHTSLLGVALVVFVLGCVPAAKPSSTPLDPTTGIAGTVRAGPVCPVERPGDPQCAPRIVSAAQIVAIDASGASVGQATTSPLGVYQILIRPGSYTIEARPVAGLIGQPGPTAVTVVAGRLVTVDLEYDTGIR